MDTFNADVECVLRKQKLFFDSGITRDVKFRQSALEKLAASIKKHEKNIYKALYQDLRKSEFESLATEVSGVIDEISFLRKRIGKWSKPRRCPVHINNKPASGRLYPEPLGSVLIFSAWNYPFNLCMTPFVGALAAGNCVVVKPADQAPATAAVIIKIIEECFDQEYVAAMPGGSDHAACLLKHKFDYIFYTGGEHAGRKVMHAAAEHLTPVTLELGGKSPCVVEPDAKLKVAAKRIVWGKFLNAGQTCVAPDYLFVHKSIKTALLREMRKVIEQFYGQDPQQSPDYPRIINSRHFQRLTGLIGEKKCFCGGESDPDDLYLAPTIIENVSSEDPVMQEEIFGPVLPVMTWDDFDEVLDFINSRPKPLAMYYFSKKCRHLDRLLSRTSAGGMCVNETVTHLTNPAMPFGGVGNSGMGAYHGKFSFDTFTHLKPVLNKYTFMDFPLRYAPYAKKLKILRFICKY
ncbi:aldehyde dehydrogenase [Lentisphaerota bacterium ZTH]|nr:aldehyde dehydrogenase [Lentisphaerota bacterium]WET06225.1 aldehyde dehydrogenase [Lentisphaerota bacterium ZTH]